MDLLHQRLERAASADPDRTFIESSSGLLTLSQLRNCAYGLAVWLSRLGVGHGDRVIVRAENDPMSVALIYAISTAGGCIVPIHPSVPKEQLAYIRDNSDAVMVLSPRAGAWVADLNGRSVNVPDLSAMCETQPGEFPLTRLGPSILSEDLACMIYTSGSTGRPKGVTCLHSGMAFAIDAIAEALDYRAGDRIFCALPLSFDYGLYQVFLALECGAVLLLEDPALGGMGLFRALKDRKASVLPAVPAMIDALAVMAKRKPRGLPELRLITNTGGAPSPATIKTLRDALPNLGFQLMYGLTECKRVSIAGVDDDLDKPGTCGVPLRGTRVEVVDETGTPVPPGTVGEFVVSGPNIMAGYWKSETLTQETYRRRHATLLRLHSGDYGWMDDDGYLYCQGRRDDLFKIRGFRVSCSEIEAAAAEAPEVQNAVMLSPAQGRSATLFICASGGEFDLAPFLKQRLEPHKLPDKIRFIDEMPRTANNKFDRKALIRLLEAEVAHPQTKEEETSYA